MATRIRRDPAKNQQRILKAATAEFARSGLGGARVDRIAARARILEAARRSGLDGRFVPIA